MAEAIQQIGAYAGFAAIIGLAVLSALYFSQARDLRRLREWAARSPERPPSGSRSAPGPRASTDRSGGARPAAPASEGAPRQTAAPAAGGAAAAVSAGAVSASQGEGAASSASASGRGSSPSATAVRAGPPAPSSIGAHTQPGGGSAGRSPAPSRGLGNSPGGASVGRGPTAPARPDARSSDRSAGRSSLPYIALAVVGVLIVVGAAAFAVGLIGGREDPQGGPAAGGAVSADPQAPVDPSSVTYSVLNATGVAGLAKQVADELEAAGYRRGNVTNATEQKAESVVLYADGARPEADAVAEELDISQTEPVDPRSRSLAGDASVVVVVGGDRAR